MAEKYLSGYTFLEETTLAVVLVIIIAVSLLSNAGMLLVFYRNDRLWNSTNILIGNLLLSGVLVTLFCMPFSLISVLYGRWPFEEGAWCKINAFAASQLLLATIFTHTMISIDKYFSVVKPFSRVMSVKRTWRIIAIIWFVAVVMTILPLFGVGKYAYNHTTLVCGVGFPTKRVETIYLTVLAGIGFVFPNIVMAYTYTHVFVAVRRHAKRLKASSVTSFDVLKLQKRLILTTMLSLGCFLACWSPFCALVLMAVFVDSPEKFPRGLGLSAYWCGYMYSALNPLIICFMSHRYSSGFGELTRSVAITVGMIFTFLFEKLFITCLNRKQSLDIQKETKLAEDWTCPLYLKTNLPSHVISKELSPATSSTDSFISLNSMTYPVGNTPF